jgi:hypothetical protein
MTGPEMTGPETSGSDAGSPELVPGRGRIGLVVGFAVFVLAADIISKMIVTAHIREFTVIHVLGNVFELTQIRNGGAAFNIGGTSMTIVFTLIAAGVVTYILRAARKLRSIGWAIALGLLLGGATGNLLDRIPRARAVPRRRGGLDRRRAQVLAVFQPGRLGDLLWRGADRDPRPARHPLRRNQGNPRRCLTVLI